MFSTVTLLVTHYNRTASLERLLSTFKERAIEFAEIIVSDDGSQPENLQKLELLQNHHHFKLIKSIENKGLGNNLNKGQDAVKTPYTLYVQEDFIPTDEFYPNFKNAVEIMDHEEDMDIIRFYSYLKYPYLKYYGKGYSEMIVKFWYANYHKIYFYSDHPHLRRSDFFNKFGRYKEGIKGDRTEYNMCLSFIQNRGRGLFFNNYKELFVQENSTDEPSTMTRNSFLMYSKNPVISLARFIYRQIRYNYDILFNKV